MTIRIAHVGPDLHDAFAEPLLTVFGLRFDSGRSERARKMTELVQRIVAYDGDTIVGSAGGYEFVMATPGGRVPVSGLTMVGVLPTHRRRGILSQLIRAHFDDARKNKIPISSLWASEGSIYGRFGYGIATVSSALSLESGKTKLKRAVPREGEMRLLSAEAALAPCQSVWERVWPTVPGMLSRTEEWWRLRRLGDFDESLQPLNRAVLFLDGHPEGYAIYRYTQKPAFSGTVDTKIALSEAIATSPKATALLWSYLCNLDIVRIIEAPFLYPSHPIFHLIAEPRRLHAKLGDAVWLRLVDVEAACAQRSFPETGAVSFRLEDELCPWNQGVYRIEGGRLSRWDGAPELAFDIDVLGSLYLGGITARALADAGLIEELSEGAVERADTLFRWSKEPFCPDMF